MSGVLVTHADSPLGLAVARALLREKERRPLVLVGSGPRPRAIAQATASAPSRRVTWLSVRLSRHRSAAAVFQGAATAESGVETVIHVPDHGPTGDVRLGPGRVPARTAEARVVLQQCREVGSVRQLVAIGSAFVYRLEPGNANRLGEEHPLDFDPDAPAEIRSWIDCDVLLREEAREGGLGVALLRTPTVIAADGGVYLNPAVAVRRARPLGFDPLCAIITDSDVAYAATAALAAGASGAFNISGLDCVPLSTLRRWHGGSAPPFPGMLLRAAQATLRRGGAREAAASLDPPYVRYGFTLDTRRAERELGFRPRSRIALPRGSDGVLHIEHTAPPPP
jgi:nucleoside-diphosphate-sugar epimerase